jgi:hypothetical protein
MLFGTRELRLAATNTLEDGTMLRMMNKAAVAGLMVGIAISVYLFVGPPAARAERVWCGEEQDQACSDYCGASGYGYYCCLENGAGYSCTCHVSEEDCE